MTPPRGSSDDLLIAESRELQITWSDLSRFFTLYWKLILVVFIATVLGTYIVLSLYSDKYETTAKVLVKVGRETIDPPPTISGRNGTLVSNGVRKEDVDSEVQILTSQDLAFQVVERLGVARFQPSGVPPGGFFPRIKFEAKKAARAVKKGYLGVMATLGLTKRLGETEEATELILKNLAATPEKESDVITLKLKLSDPVLGKEVLKQWLSIYLLRRVEIRQSVGVREFLSEEVVRVKSQLEQLEKARNGWKGTHALSQTAAQKQALIEQIRHHAAAEDQTEAEIHDLTAELSAAQQRLAQTPQTLKTAEVETVNPPVTAYRSDLTSLEIEKAKLLAKYEPQSERITRLTEEIERLKALIKSENANQISSATLETNPLFRALELQIQTDSVHLDGLKNRAVAEAAQKRALEVQLAGLESADATLSDLERERQMSEEHYMALIKRENEADVTNQLDRRRLSNVAILESPESSFEPVSPKRELIMGLSLILGLLLGIGLAILFDALSGKPRVRGNSPAIGDAHVDEAQ